MFALNAIDKCMRKPDKKISVCNCMHLYLASAPIVRCGLQFTYELSAMFGVCKRFTCWVLFPSCSNFGRHRQMVIVFCWRFPLFFFSLSFSLSKYAVRQMNIHSDGKCIVCPNIMFLLVCCTMLEFVLQIKRKTIN